MQWKQVWELVPFEGIRDEAGELLPFGITRKELRKKLGSPEGTFSGANVLQFPDADNYGAELAGHLAVGYRKDPGIFNGEKTPRSKWVTGTDRVAEFGFEFSGRSSFQGIRLNQKPVDVVLPELAKLGHVAFVPPRDLEHGRFLRVYYPELGLQLFTVGGKVSSVTLWEREILKKVPQLVEMYTLPYGPAAKTAKAPKRTAVKRLKPKPNTIVPGPPLPSIRITTAKVAEARLKLGQSKLGGKPDLPKKLKWPEDAAFLGQLNFAELSKFDRDGVLPKSGIAYFFFRYEAEIGKVLFFDGDASELARREPPEFIENSYNACRLKFKVVDERKLGGGSEDPVYEQFAEIKLLGYPAPVQDYYWEFNYAKELLLFQMMNDENVSFDVGDGALFFKIGRKDLAAGRFGRVQFSRFG